MLDPFTLHDGVLELDEGKGAWDGPRIVDPAAGLIRYKVGDKTIPVVDLRAVAVVYVERDLMSGLGTRGKARLRK